MLRDSDGGPACLNPAWSRPPAATWPRTRHGRAGCHAGLRFRGPALGPGEVSGRGSVCVTGEDALESGCERGQPGVPGADPGEAAGAAALPKGAALAAQPATAAAASRPRGRPGQAASPRRTGRCPASRSALPSTAARPAFPLRAAHRRQQPGVTGHARQQRQQQGEPGRVVQRPGAGDLGAHHADRQRPQVTRRPGHQRRHHRAAQPGQLRRLRGTAAARPLAGAGPAAPGSRTG